MTRSAITYVAAAALAASTLLAGCVTREDIRGIQTDLYSIQKGIETRIGSVEGQTESVQTSQADLSQAIQSLSSQITSLQTELADYQQRMAQLSTRLDDLEASLTARMDTQIELLSGSKFVEKPLPSTQFNLANTDFARGRYAEAVKGFEAYLKQYPKSAGAAEARLKIGDANVKLKNLEDAVDSYDALIRDFPKDRLVPTALLRKGSALESLGRRQQAKETYVQIIKNWSYAPEAKTAQDRVRALGS